MLTDLLANRLDGMIISTSVVMPYIKDGKLRALAVSSSDRLKELDGVPTIAESGFPGFDAPVGLGVLVRSGTPKPIVDRLSTDIRKVMNEAPFVEWLAGMSTTTTNLTPEEFRARSLREISHYQQLIQKSKIKFEE
jgi:tripartite-type tricarboxylate transporter receptor subunit TctC